MTRLMKELRARGIVFEEEGWNSYGESEDLLTITDKFIITTWGCDVLDPQFRIYDRFTFEPIGGQDMFKSQSLCSNRPDNQWNSFIFFVEESGGVTMMK